MSLRKKTVAVPLTGPLERRNGGEDLTANLTQLPGTARALNVYRSRTGEWKRRPGHVDDYPGTGVEAAGVLAAAHVGGERRVLLTSGKQLSRSDAGASYRSVDYGYAQASIVKTSLVRRVSDFTADDSGCQSVKCAIGGGVMLAMTSVLDNGTRYLSVSTFLTSDMSSLSAYHRDPATWDFGADIPHFAVLYSAVLDRFVILFTTPGTPSGSATKLAAFALSPAQAISGSVNLQSWAASSTSIATDLIGYSTSPNTHFDAMVEEDTGLIIVAYRGASSHTRALRFNPATMSVGTGPVTVVSGGDVAANGIAIARVGTWSTTQTGYHVITAINSAVGVVARIISKTTLLQSSSSTVKTSPGNVGAVCASIIAGTDGGASVNNVQAVNWDVINAAVSRSAVWRAYRVVGTWSVGEYTPSTRLHGHPFYAPSLALWILPICGSIDSAGKLIFAHQFFLNGRHVYASALDGRGDFAPAHLGSLVNAAVDSDGAVYYGAVTWLSRSGDPELATTDPAAFTKLASAVRLEFPASGVGPSVQIDAETAVIPGSAWRFADRSVHSSVPWSAYQSGPITGAAITGGVLGAGDVYYVTLPVCVDPSGRRWTGIPSVPVKVTLTALSSVNVDMTGVLSGYFGDTSLELYRTKVNGTQWFRLHESPYDYGSGVGFNDDVADADLETGLALYSDSGEMLHYPPPPSVIAWIAGQRLLCIDSENPANVYASSEFTPGEGPWFNPDMRISLPGGEEVVAGAFMDGRSFLFTRKGIFALAGAWPGRTGAGQLPEVQRIAQGMGGYSQASTLVTKEGTWFYSEDRGLCLLDRGLGIQTPGKQIDGVVTSAPVGALQAEGFDQARFYLSNGVVAVYDQVERQWSHWQLDLTAIGGSVTCVYVHNRDVFVCGPTGTMKEDATALDDAGVAFEYGLDVRIPIGQPGGRARVYRASLAGLYYGDTTLTCTVFNDFGQVGSGEDTKLIVVKGRPGETTPSMYQVTFRPRHGRCESMLLRLSCQSTDPGITFRSLAMEVGGYDPVTVKRLPGSRQA